MYEESQRAFLESTALPVLEKPVDNDTLEGFVSAPIPVDDGGPSEEP